MLNKQEKMNYLNLKKMGLFKSEEEYEKILNEENTKDEKQKTTNVFSKILILKKNK